MKCPICSTEAVEKDMLFSKFWYCSKCKEDIKYLESKCKPQEEIKDINFKQLDEDTFTNLGNNDVEEWQKEFDEFWDQMNNTPLQPKT